MKKNKEDSSNSLNKKIAPYIKNFGQEIVNTDNNDNFFKKVDEIIFENYSKINSENLNLNKEFESSLNEKKKMSEIFSYTELYRVSRIKDVKKIFGYLNFRYIFNLASKRKIILDAPPYVLIEPVSACNFRCPMCFQVDSTFTKKPYMGVMKWDLFCKVVDEADRIGTGAITLASRGEPTMHPKLGEMLEYLKSKKNIYEVKINTNASFLTEDLARKILKSEVTTIVISGDHYEKEKFEELRKNSIFEKIVENVKNLYEIRKKEFPNSETEIRISGVDHNRNLDREKFKTFWEKISDNVSVSYAVERWDTYNNAKTESINSPCSFLWDRMYVWFDGKCNPCDADYKSYLSYGNVKNQSIKEVWNSNELQKIKEQHVNGKRNCLEPCDRCGIEFN